mmetsp:Transcript_24319/g.57241  ORF Transcript_24319/g.57241 Transcript_24319/m.57241 type:complete len:680 (+) Transcript_24319:91-2130(+)|eukprot:CAMPEP_0197176626 /NCGR_PEP_ID=MMETSP1423-20130617/2484_1 /TAXON_ID=476441 /ORGANISM="Pseudo-nitzschia heimii, Strain UNC1101" /LENGTH=679 /DNA_ID=CAMNT_0042626025 /DNA_START=19 /DNA_END=2058 /DNA_ORIENTATION=+
MSSEQNSGKDRQQHSSSMERKQRYHHQQEDPPEMRHSAYEGRWVLDSNGEKMIYVVDAFPPVPKTVIPLPAPPSDCGSAFYSDSSLTVSQYTADPYARNLTFDEMEVSNHSQIMDGDEEDEDDTVNENAEENTRSLLGSIPVDKSTARSFGSDKKSNASTAMGTADLTDDLEDYRYPQGIFRPGHYTGMSKKYNSNQPKKQVRLMEPAQSWTEEKHQQIQEIIQKTERRAACCRKIVYLLFFVSFLTIAIGGGLYAMVYYNIIDLGNLSLGDSTKEKPTVTVTATTTSDLGEPQELSDELFDAPMTRSPTLSPSSSPSKFLPTASPTVSAEGSFIIDTLSGQFRVNLPEDDPLAPPNRAVDWMVNELKSVKKGHFNYQYNNLGKFGQRFAILSTQYSLLGEDDTSRFSFDQQLGIDECLWEGVHCDDYGRVIRLDYSDLELTGRIPSEIRYLFKLEILDLSNNSITGSIPNEVYDLQNLNRLYLYQNKLTGTISTWIGQLHSLRYLHLSQNLLSGRIPEELRSYSYSVLNPLIHLNLYDNQLTGTIPNSLNLGNLLYFDIGRNNIGGSIPDDIGTDYGELKYLHIDHNRLTGSIPDSIPLMANGRMISLLADHNELSGTVPDNWIMFNKLVQYTIQENNFWYLGPENCKMNVFSGGQCVEFKADCNICSCNDNFCDAMC